MRPFFAVLFIAHCLALTQCAGTQEEKSSGNEFSIPVDYYKLENGLKVVLSEDKTAPVVTVAVYYKIGFRIEPKGRTGFAHLFEHMMFQGSENLGKMEFIKLVQSNGGVLNGSTRFDFTNYYEVMPAHTLKTVLWAEADRMRGLNITQENLTNQQGVVKNEVKVNVLNQPYGGFPWLDMPQYANENWFNAHNFYGDLADLDSANLQDVEWFFQTYYSPSNAVLVLTGDFETARAKEWVTEYFGGIPSSPSSPDIPDLKEPGQTEEKRFTKVDKLANKPAVAVAYKMPERNTPEYFAMGLIDQLLLQGEDSRLHQKLVQDRGYTAEVGGGINYLGNMYNYNGPMLWMFDLIYDETTQTDSILADVNAAITSLRNELTQEDVDRARIKLRSSFYDILSEEYGVGKADLLACFALFDDNPSRINSLEAEFARVTLELVRQTLDEFLRPSNRTILINDGQAPSS